MPASHRTWPYRDIVMRRSGDRRGESEYVHHNHDISARGGSAGSISPPLQPNRV
jgi:hypothetical protein